MSEAEQRQENETKQQYDELFAHRRAQAGEGLDVRAFRIVKILETDPELKAAVLARLGYSS